MNKLFLINLFVLSTALRQAQTFDEWFRQNKTQKKYLIEQIAALNVYLHYVRNGYYISQKGLNVISSIKQGDFDLHHAFFQVLQNVNPKIGKYAKVADIVIFQRTVLKVYRDISKKLKMNGLFNSEEINYVTKVIGGVLNDCATIIIQLTDVIRPAVLEMKDDERLKRIDALYAEMHEACTFAQGFSAEINLLGLQRTKEKAGIQRSRVLHGNEKQ